MPELEGKISGDARGFTDASRKAQRSLGRLEKKGEAVGSKLSGAFKGMLGGLASITKAAGVAGAALSAAGTASIVSFAKFQSKFAQVQTLIDDGSVNVQKLQRDLRDLSVTMGVDVLEATEAAYQAISAGQDPAKVVDFLDASFKGAAAGAATATEAVDLFTTVLNAFQSQTQDVTEVADVMFATIKAGKTTASELATSIGQVAPVAASAGVRFEDMSAALATVTASGLNTAEAATSLKATITGILKPSQKAQKALESIGVTSDTLADTNLGLEDAIDKVRKAVEKGDRKLVDFFPNVRALNGVAILAGEGFNKFKTSLDATRNASGAAEKAFGKVRDTISFQFSSAVQGAKDAFRTLGEALLPIATEVVRAFTGMAEKVRSRLQAFRDFFQANSESIKKAVRVLVDAVRVGFEAFFAAVGINLGGAGDTFKNFVDSINRNRKQIIESARQMGQRFGAFAKGMGQAIKKLIVAFGELAKAAGLSGKKTSEAFSSVGGTAAAIIVAFEGAKAAILAAGNAAAKAIFFIAQKTLQAVAFLTEGLAAAVALVAGEGAAGPFDRAAKKIREAQKLMGDAAEVSSGKLDEQIGILGSLGTRFDQLKRQIDGATDAEKANTDAIESGTTARKNRSKFEQDEERRRSGRRRGRGRGRDRFRRRGGGRRGFLGLGIIRGQRGAGFPGLRGAAGQFGTVNTGVAGGFGIRPGGEAGFVAGRGFATGAGPGRARGRPVGAGAGARGAGGQAQQAAFDAAAQLFARFKELAIETAQDEKVSGAFEAVKGRIKDVAKAIGTEAFGPAFLRFKTEIAKQLEDLIKPEAFTASVVVIQDSIEEAGKKIESAKLSRKFEKIQKRFVALGDATGPEAQRKFQRLADEMKRLAESTEDPLKTQFSKLADQMSETAKKAGEAGLAKELMAASSAMDALKDSAKRGAEGISAAAGSIATGAFGQPGQVGGQTFTQGRRSISGRRISDVGQIESRQLGGFLNRTGLFSGHRGEFVIRRRAAQAIGADVLRQLNRQRPINATSNLNIRERGSRRSAREQLRILMPEMRRQQKLAIRQGGPF